MADESWPPSAHDIVELPVDELALRALRSFVGSGGPPANVHRGNFGNLSMWANIGDEYKDTRVLRRLSEAFDWLALHGLVAISPGETMGWGYVTERGVEAALDKNAAATIRASKRIDVDLHPALARRVRRQFLLGEFEQAVLLAFREVEIRVRDLGGFDSSAIGSKLMMDAFSPDKPGPLVDTDLDRGEQQAVMFLFAGAIGAFKNPSSHRQVDYGDPTIAAEAVLLADLLMRTLERYEDPSAAPAKNRAE